MTTNGRLHRFLDTPRQGVYFRGFDALRFYAALSVIVQHVSYSPHDWFGVPTLPETLERLFLNGSDAVNLFFVLSGFLITFLLLSEQDHAGKVSIRNFYVRRAFRIYPVYFAYLAVVFVLLGPRYPPELILSLVLFMGNVAFVRFFPFPPLEHLWSIGVEEQYYLLAPIMVRQKHRLWWIAAAIVAAWWSVLALTALLPPSPVTAFVQMSRYDLIALGALTAVACYRQWPLLRILDHSVVLGGALALIAYAVVFVPPPIHPLHGTLLGLAFAVVIYRLATARSLPRVVDHPAMEYLGKLSYSMYVYHPLYVLLVYSVLSPRLDVQAYSVVAYPLVIGLTLLSSVLSFRLIEKPMLALKDRFKAKVVWRDRSPSAQAPDGIPGTSSPA